MGTTTVGEVVLWWCESGLKMPVVSADIAAMAVVAGLSWASRALLQAEMPENEIVPCETGVMACENPDLLAGEPCSPYNGKYKEPSQLSWVMALAAIFGALMAFGIGSNDAANSWGTSVGSKAIPLRWAMFIGGIMEWFGAISLGYGVSKKIQKGVSAPDDYECWGCGYCDSRITIYMLGMMCALISASIFLLLCSFTAMPVSTTHAIVGAVVGITMVGTRATCLNWSFDGGLGGIIASWGISPAVSGVIGAVTYLITHRITIKSKNPRRNSIIVLPILYCIVVFIMVFLILLKSKPTKEMDKGIMAAIAIGCGVGVALIVAIFLNPYIKKRLPSVVAEKKKAEGITDAVDDSPSTPSVNGEGSSRDASPRAITGGNQSFAGDSAAGTPTKSMEKQKSLSEKLLGGLKKSFKGESKESTWVDPKDPAQKGGQPVHYGADFGAHHQEAGNSAIIYEEKKADLRAKSSFFTLTYGDADEQRKGDYDRPIEEIDAIFVYRYLLVFVAALESYAHGANDTANATSAFTAVYETYTKSLNACAQGETPLWIMAVAGFFVFLGMNTFGYRVVRTIGTNITDINYHRGFCIEVASTLTVVIATILEMPVSTTHCQVGAVCVVGFVAFGPRYVSWWLIARIILSWILTLPFAGGIAGGLLAALRPAVVA